MDSDAIINKKQNQMKKQTKKKSNNKQNIEIPVLILKWFGNPI